MHYFQLCRSNLFFVVHTCTFYFVMQQVSKGNASQLCSYLLAVHADDKTLHMIVNLDRVVFFLFRRRDLMNVFFSQNKSFNPPTTILF